MLREKKNKGLIARGFMGVGGAAGLVRRGVFVFRVGGEEKGKGGRGGRTRRILCLFESTALTGSLKGWWVFVFVA